MFGRKKRNLNTPADTHLKELLHKYNVVKNDIGDTLFNIEILQKAQGLTPTCMKNDFKSALDKAKDRLAELIGKLTSAKQDYEAYYAGTRNARVTTANWKSRLTEPFDVVYEHVANMTEEKADE